MAAGVSEYLIGLIIKVSGNKEAKAALDDTKNAVQATTAAVSDGAKATNRLFQALSASSARFASLIPTDLPFGQLAKDMLRVTSASAGVANSMKGLGISLGVVAGTVAGIIGSVLALAKAFELLKTAVQEAAKSQEAILGLSNALKTMGVNSTGAVNAATNLANALQSVTKFSDEEILSTQALLAQLGGLTGKGLEEATRATLDLAAGLGRDLPTAALIMAKAAQGSTFELRKYGLVLDDNIPKTERWAAALEFVQRKFGGRAEAELVGLTAQIRQFGGAYKDVLTLLGQPVVIPLTGKLRELTGVMLEYTAFVDKANKNRLNILTPDLDDFIDQIAETEAEISRLQTKITGPVNPTFLAKTREQIKELQKDVLNMRSAMGLAIAEFAQTTDLPEVLEEEGDLIRQRIKDWQAYRKVQLEVITARELFGNASAALLEQERKLKATWQESEKAVRDLQAARDRRVTGTVDAASKSLKSLLGVVRTETSGLREDLSLKFDVQVSDIGKELEAKLRDPHIQELLKNAPPLDFDVKDLELQFEVASKSKEKLAAFLDSIRSRLISISPEIATNNIGVIKAAKALHDFLQNTVAKQGPIAFDVIAEKEAVNRVLAIAKNLRQEIAVSRDQVTVVDPTAKEKVTTLEGAIAQLREELQRLIGLDPKQMVLAWNRAMEQFLAIEFPTERAKQLADQAGQALTKEFLPKIQEANRALEAELGSGTLQKQFQLALRAEDFDQAQKLLDQIKEKLDLITEGPIKDELELRFKADTKALDNAIEKAQDLDKNLNKFQGIFRIHLELKDFNAAKQDIAEIEKLLAGMEASPTKLKIELELKRMRKSLNEAENINADFADRIQDQYRSMVEGFADLSWEAPADLLGSSLDTMLDATANAAEEIPKLFVKMVADILKAAVKLLALRTIFAIIFPGKAAKDALASITSLAGLGGTSTKVKLPEFEDPKLLLIPTSVQKITQPKPVEISVVVQKVVEPEPVEIPVFVQKLIQPEPVKIPTRVQPVLPPDPVEVPTLIQKLVDPKPVEVPFIMQRVIQPKPVEIPVKVQDVAQPEPLVIQTLVQQIKEPKPIELPVIEPTVLEPAPVEVPTEIQKVRLPPPIEIPVFLQEVEQPPPLEIQTLVQKVQEPETVVIPTAFQALKPPPPVEIPVVVQEIEPPAPVTVPTLLQEIVPPRPVTVPTLVQPVLPPDPIVIDASVAEILPPPPVQIQTVVQKAVEPEPVQIPVLVQKVAQPNLIVIPTRVQEVTPPPPIEPVVQEIEPPDPVRIETLVQKVTQPLPVEIPTFVRELEPPKPVEIPTKIQRVLEPDPVQVPTLVQSLLPPDPIRVPVFVQRVRPPSPVSIPTTIQEVEKPRPIVIPTEVQRVIPPPPILITPRVADVVQPEPVVIPTIVQRIAEPEPVVVPTILQDIAQPAPVVIQTRVQQVLPPDPIAPVVQEIVPPKPITIPTSVQEIVPPEPITVPVQLQEIIRPQPITIPTRVQEAVPPRPVEIPTRIQEILKPKPLEIPMKPLETLPLVRAAALEIPFARAHFVTPARLESPFAARTGPIQTPQTFQEPVFRRKVEFNIDTLDPVTLHRSLLYGPLGREMERVLR